MNTNQLAVKETILSKVNTKSLALSISAGLAITALTSNAQAASPFQDAINADQSAAKSLTGNQGAAEQGLGSLYTLGKYFAIVLGLFLAIGGLVAVSKAAKAEGQKSQMPGWISFGIGGLLTVVGGFMFMVGKTATNVIGGDAT